MERFEELKVPKGVRRRREIQILKDYANVLQLRRSGAIGRRPPVARSAGRADGKSLRLWSTKGVQDVC